MPQLCCVNSTEIYQNNLISVMLIHQYAQTLYIKFTFLMFIIIIKYLSNSYPYIFKISILQRTEKIVKLMISFWLRCQIIVIYLDFCAEKLVLVVKSYASFLTPQRSPVRWHFVIWLQITVSNKILLKVSLFLWQVV